MRLILVILTLTVMACSGGGGGSGGSSAPAVASPAPAPASDPGSPVPFPPPPAPVPVTTVQALIDYNPPDSSNTAIDWGMEPTTMTIDLTKLHAGFNYSVTLDYVGSEPKSAIFYGLVDSAPHTCQYQMNLTDTTVEILDFLGCDPGTPFPGPGFLAGDSCLYCPGAGWYDSHEHALPMNITIPIQ